MGDLDPQEGEPPLLYRPLTPESPGLDNALGVCPGEGGPAADLLILRS